MKKVLFVVGTRPEIIKTASVIGALERNRAFKTAVCLSGQHISMVDQMLKDFRIKLDYDLKIMEKNQTLITISRKIMPGLEKVYNDFDPDIVFVQGDTTTAFMAAFVAFCMRVKVAHIEAGLRTFDKNFPFPEEMNRTLVTKLADIHYAPTKQARENLISEGIPKSSIIVTGNTGIDSFMHMSGREYGFINEKLSKIPKGKKIILLTAHRRENVGKKMEDIFTAVKEIAVSYQDVFIVYPVHPNPAVKTRAYKMLSGEDNIILVKSLHYRDMVKLVNMSYLLMTDSGGLQEEAPSIGKPVIVLRDKTERPEAVEAGSAILVGSDKRKILRAFRMLAKGGPGYRAMAVKRDIFGDGNASVRIARDLGTFFKRQDK